MNNKEELKKLQDLIGQECYNFLHKNIGRKTKDLDVENFKNEIRKTLIKAEEDNIFQKIYQDYGFKVKKTKLPRKLKKRYKKERRICLDILYQKPIEYLDFTIHLESEGE